MHRTLLDRRQKFSRKLLRSFFFMHKKKTKKQEIGQNYLKILSVWDNCPDVAYSGSGNSLLFLSLISCSPALSILIPHSISLSALFLSFFLLFFNFVPLLFFLSIWLLFWDLKACVAPPHPLRPHSLRVFDV